MKVVVRIKEELSDDDSEYSSDISNNSNSNSVDLGPSGLPSNAETPISAVFANFDGVHTGVPTRTTPTLTPTTLRNIEQTLEDFARQTEREEPHHNEARFEPPVVHPLTQGKNTYMSLVDSKAWIGGSTTITSTQTPMNSRPTVVSSAATAAMPLVHNPAAQSPRRNMGGRRPAKNCGISPEEEERRRIRRERNKQAAARCRKRRLDHTNTLQQETDGLEKKKHSLQREIQDLTSQKEQLEFLLEAHKACCRRNGSDGTNPPSPPDVKPVLLMDEDSKYEDMVIAPSSQVNMSKRPLVATTAIGHGNKPPRPCSLPVFAPKPAPPTTILEVAGVPITTPSSGMPFNFESLMEGGTGLTPVSGTGLTPMIPSCSSQQRNSTGMDLSSPETSYPPKLVSL